MQADHAIHVTFKAAPASSYTITATAGGNGSITPAGDSTVEAGKDATFTFSPNSGYAVDVVTVDGEAVAVTGNSYTFANVHSNHTIHVTFKYVGGGYDDDDDDDDDDDTPPEVIVDPEIPLAQPEVPGETEEIADPEVPLANLPEEPATDVPEETVEENDVPLANLPKTGGLTGLGIGAAGLATILTGMNLRKKEK